MINDDALSQSLVFIVDADAADHQAPKSPMDILTSCKIFCNNFNWWTSTNLPKTLNNIHNRLFFAMSRNKSDHRVLKKFQGRPSKTSCKIFCKSYKQICVYKSPKNIELYTIHCIEYRLLCDTQATYRAIKVIVESWKSTKDVLKDVLQQL